MKVLFIILILAGIYCYWRFFYFFRDPDRRIPQGNNIVSHADGKIVYVRKIKRNVIPLSIKQKKEIKLEELTKSPYYDNGDDKYLIGIFMRPTSVHINRAPIDGKIKDIHYFKHSNFPMTRTWLRVLLGIKPYFKESKYLLHNERNTIIIEGVITAIVIQIADIYVNKIECWVNKNDSVKKGDRIGMIKMGSQVDLLIPAKENIKIAVKEGDSVKAGESIIAEFM